MRKYIVIFLTFVQFGCVVIINSATDFNISKTIVTVATLLSVILKILVDAYIYFLLITQSTFLNKVFKENTTSASSLKNSKKWIILFYFVIFACLLDTFCITIGRLIYNIKDDVSF